MADLAFFVLLMNEAQEATGELLPKTQRELADFFNMSARRIGERLGRLRDARLIRYVPDPLEGGSVIGIVGYERFVSIAGAAETAPPGAAETAPPGTPGAAAGAAIGAAIDAAETAPRKGPWPAGSQGETYETEETEETTTKSSARARARDDRSEAQAENRASFREWFETLATEEERLLVRRVMPNLGRQLEDPRAVLAQAAEGIGIEQEDP